VCKVKQIGPRLKSILAVLDSHCHKMSIVDVSPFDMFENVHRCSFLIRLFAINSMQYKLGCRVTIHSDRARRRPKIVPVNAASVESSVCPHPTVATLHHSGVSRFGAINHSFRKSQISIVQVMAVEYVDSCGRNAL
jgi:hypothetical protein